VLFFHCILCFVIVLCAKKIANNASNANAAYRQSKAGRVLGSNLVYSGFPSFLTRRHVREIR